MFTNLRRYIGTRFAKIVNIAALVSILSSLFTFAPMLPVHAIESLQSLETTLAQPIFSADWDTDPSYTNITYTWKQFTAFQANTGDPCIGETEFGSCVFIDLQMQETGDAADHDMQEWMPTIDETDFTLSSLPANAVVASVSRSDIPPEPMNGRYSNLRVYIECTAACVFATSTEYTLTIVNSPLKNQEQPAGYVQGTYSTTTANFVAYDGSVAGQDGQALTSIVAVGKGITVSASVDPSLYFYIEGGEAASFYGEGDDEVVNNSATDDSCDFGTLTPGIAKYCTWTLAIGTNASNGYSIYVVQDQNMTFNGNTIKQFDNAIDNDARLDDSAATIWNAPTAARLAHLGYSSNDPTVFVNSAPAEWAGIPNIATAGEAPVTTGLVADSSSPGEGGWSYAIKIESASTLPQGTGYTHHEYFLVVGNF